MRALSAWASRARTLSFGSWRCHCFPPTAGCHRYKSHRLNVSDAGTLGQVTVRMKLLLFMWASIAKGTTRHTHPCSLLIWGWTRLRFSWSLPSPWWCQSWSWLFGYWRRTISRRVSLWRFALVPALPSAPTWPPAKVAPSKTPTPEPSSPPVAVLLVSVFG